MSVSPFLRIPFTDLTGNIHSEQMLGRCAKEEELAMNCMEAYGVGRGFQKCSDLLDELNECQNMTKQFKRFYAMRRERERQISEGKLKGDDKFVNPKVDSY